jgi:hypothetical protein
MPPKLTKALALVAATLLALAFAGYMALASFLFLADKLLF